MNPMAVEAVVSEVVSCGNCTGTGNFFGFQDFFKAKNDGLVRDFCRLVGKFPADGTGYFADGAGGFFVSVQGMHT